jgi:hypothetical protein
MPGGEALDENLVHWRWWGERWGMNIFSGSGYHVRGTPQFGQGDSNDWNRLGLFCSMHGSCS